MKIVELEISNVRGIHHLLLKPNNNNFVIWGPNGAGKSAVVDAIDFLLTGQILRLTGEGTKGITLKRHGPHIDKSPSEATVRALVSLHNGKHTIEISRNMETPGDLFLSDESLRPKLNTLLNLASRGQHVLTRREILKYITSEAGDRAKKIQVLLNITEIEKIRTALVSVKNTASDNIKTTKRNVDKVRTQVCVTLDHSTFSNKLILESINNERKILGGPPISKIRHMELKSAIKLPQLVSGDQTINISLLEKDFSNLLELCLDETQNELSKLDKNLREALQKLHADPILIQALQRRELIKNGLGLLDIEGRCPLCGKAWPEGKLEKHLKSHLNQAKSATKFNDEIKRKVKKIQDRADKTLESLGKVKIATQKVNLEIEYNNLTIWEKKLNKFNTQLSSVTKEYLGTKEKDIAILFSPVNLNDILSLIHSTAKKKFPESSPEQNAWDTLTRLEENLKSLEKEEQAHNLAIRTERKSKILHDSFLEARDKILGELYEDIKTRFINLYKQLHGSDEEAFAAIIEPDGARLNIEVDFHGRGTFPPHALHSEGHQDSMGICLFLALAEKLTQGEIDLIILDDVVMSVDSNHRRELCTVLANSFPDRQFLITTHDKTWANQLKSEGVVPHQNTIEFYNWQIETGPHVNYEAEMWQKIEEDVKNNDIPSAASRLRRGSEEYFSLVADHLHAEVRYKLNGRWDLGDFQFATTRQYKNLIDKAIKAANSWGKAEEVEKLKEFKSIRKQIVSRTYQEQWATNANVHFNNWANFVENDFRPLIDAYQDLFNLFSCIKCGSLIHLTTKGLKPVNVKCRCGEINWNLEGKQK